GRRRAADGSLFARARRPLVHWAAASLPGTRPGTFVTGLIQRGSAFSALGVFEGVGSRSGGTAAGNATMMKAKRENTPIVCAQAALAIVVKPIPATRQAMASLGSNPGARAAMRERA